MFEVDRLIKETALQAAREAVDRAFQQKLPVPEYLSTMQAAAYLGLSRQQLEIWRSKGGGPRYVKLDHAVRYKRSSLDEFMASRVREHTAET